MLLANNGLTTPLLEASLGTTLRIRVLRQHTVPATAVSETVTKSLGLGADCDVVVRRSGLVCPDLTLVSMNQVVTATSAAARYGLDGPGPIGYHLTSRGVVQSRRILWAGLAEWIDERPCAAKDYVIEVHGEPVCYIRECFNPELIAADTAGPAGSAPEPILAVPRHDSTPLDPIAHDNAPASHQPYWPDPAAARRHIDRLRALPPLVAPAESEALTKGLAEAARGRAFVLHLGDCAESFDQCDAGSLTNRQALAAATAAVVTFGLGIPSILIGRMAGQYAKPRSQPIEPGTGLPSYLGDMINGYDADVTSRTPDPARLVDAYFHASVTVNHLRTQPLPPAAATAELIRQAAQVSDPQCRARLLRDVADLLRSAVAAPPGARTEHGVSAGPGMWVSHEALVLDYERALTRRGPDGRWWDGSAHLLWVGERTRDPDHAHIRFVERIGNPVAVKLGPAARPDDVATLCHRLNPDRVAGRLTLIPRLGAERAATALPPLLEAAAATGIPVCWVCDPMHGNTFTTDQGLKSRQVDDVLGEMRAFFGACREVGVPPGGLHLETAPEPVTECVGGWQRLRADDLAGDYRTRCDPRLNAVQTLQCVTVAVEELGS